MLDNTAKLSDIITALQNLEGINQKADLKSALFAKGVSVSDTDSVAQLISKLNSANLVLDGLKTSKGTFPAMPLGGTLDINTLAFKPKYVIIYTYTEGYPEQGYTAIRILDIKGREKAWTDNVCSVTAFLSNGFRITSHGTYPQAGGSFIAIEG